MIYLLINNIITAILVIIAYNIGTKSNTVAKSENIPKKKIEIKIPHIKTREEKKTIKEIEKQLQIQNQIIRNIDNYDGTKASQKKIKY